jgi:hypothetical protein
VNNFHTVGDRRLNFFDVKSKRGDTIFFMSAPFISQRGIFPSSDGNYIMGYPATIDRSDDVSRDHLAANVNHAESRVAPLLRDAVKSTSPLPAVLRDAYLRHPYLRPTFRSERNITWFTLSPGCAYFNWQGQHIAANQMVNTPGEYQFILRCNGIYMGSHGSLDNVASLNLRIAQIRYRPIDIFIDDYSLPAKCMMTDEPMEEEEEPAAVNPVEPMEEDEPTVVNPFTIKPVVEPAAKKPALKRRQAFRKEKSTPKPIDENTIPEVSDL